MPGHTRHAGEFLRRRPVERSVLLGVATSRLGERPGEGAEANLWLWVEEGEQVFAAAQHTPPHGAYLSTGPVAAMHLMARALRELRPALPGVGGISQAPREFAAEWARSGGGPASAGLREALYAADAVTFPSGVAGCLRPATPPRHRRQGYASACVARLTAHALAHPGRTCMLYADLANPTSNGIYQAIGYRRVGDAVDLRLTDLRAQGAPTSGEA